MDIDSDLAIHPRNVGDDKHADTVLDCYVLHVDVFEKAK
jgi:hypothetical protein